VRWRRASNSIPTGASRAWSRWVCARPGPPVPLVDMSGRVPPLAVEVVPSRMPTTLLILNFEILLGPVGLGSLAG
jgi:hypothetical protein